MSFMPKPITPGMIHVYTGDGKGKTTAALGLAIRAAGAGKKVAIVYFDKGGRRYSERKLLRRLKPLITFWASGKSRTDYRQGGRFRFTHEADDYKEARRGITLAAKAVVSKKYDLVILDEILTSVKTNLVNPGEVLGLMASKRIDLELVLTGRGATPAIIDKADLVSEIKEIKHYFKQGTPARKGIDL